MEENQNLEQNTNNLVIKIEEPDSTLITTDPQGINDSNNTVDDSNAPHHWLPTDIKQEKEEEEQSISQREDLLDFTDQDQYKIKMEENENQDQEHHIDNLVIKREESESPSATTDTQGIDNSNIKQEKEEQEEQSISQRGDLLDFNQNPEQHTNNPVKREESDSPSATTDAQGIDNSDIKQEKEEEEEQSISQRGDLLDFTDQDQEQNQNRMEENQNPEHHTNNPAIKRKESDSPSATTDTQDLNHRSGVKQEELRILLDFTERTETAQMERATERKNQNQRERMRRRHKRDCDEAEHDAVGGRKRKGKDNWKKHEAKRRRMMGQLYVGRTKKGEVTKDPRGMGPPCTSAACVRSTKHHCRNIEEADREMIFKRFWENMNWEEKKMYVSGLVDVIPVQRRKGSEHSRRSSTFVFFLRVNGQRLRVCRGMFLATMGIGTWSAQNWVQDTDATERKTALRHIEAHEFIRSFLNDLPKVPSHYCRSSTSKQYLEPVFQSMADLHREYHRAAEEKMVRPLSSKVFTEEFKQQNLGLYHPKKDQCDTCCSFKAGNLAENEWQDHLLKKEEACAEKVQDKNKANDKTMVVCMDLQALFLCPSLKASALYYKTKLAVHNFTLYEMSTQNATCYVWHEGEGTLSASEFASCVINFLSEHKEHEEYILWSDGCGYQNHNSVLSNALLNFCMETKKVVTQKFLEEGHTQMECDSVHSVIKRRLRNQKIYVPAEYVALMKSARSKPNPYKVKYVDHTFFQDFTNLRLCRSICPGIKPGDPTDVRAIRYNINGTMDFKTQHSDDWRPKQQLRHTSSPAVTPLYTNSLKIEEMKYKHLQELKEVIPKDFHSFYDNLKH